MQFSSLDRSVKVDVPVRDRFDLLICSVGSVVFASHLSELVESAFFLVTGTSLPNKRTRQTSVIVRTATYDK
jgi:hypothetical protein